jgi:non-specific serine/threonine protein kinase
MTAAAHGRPERALRLGGAADALRSSIGTPLGTAARKSFDVSLDHARRMLPADAAEAAWTGGQALPLEKAIAEALIDAASPHRARLRDDPTAQLSAREREVAVLVAEGLTSRDSAERLVVSERTAENHVQRVLNRLDLRSRAQLAAWAVRHGLTATELPPPA